MSNTEIIDKRLSPETIIAAALLTPRVDGNLRLSQIAKLILRLRNKGVDISRMTCYSTGGSAHCDDLDRFVSKIHSFKYARDLSPVTLEDEGRKLCQKLLSDAKSTEDNEQLQELPKKLKEALDELGYVKS